MVVLVVLVVALILVAVCITEDLGFLTGSICQILFDQDWTGTMPELWGPVVAIRWGEWRAPPRWRSWT